MYRHEREQIFIPICCNELCEHMGEAVIKKDKKMDNPVNGFEVYIKFRCPRCGTVHAVLLNTYELVLDLDESSTIY